MSKTRVALIDADGVLITPEKLFSEQYASEKGFDPKTLEPFFRSSDFIDATEGRADLIEVVEKYRDLWHLEGSPSKLLEAWFDGENVVDQELLEVLRAARSNGVPVFMATNQERHRARYLRERMFPNDFDGFFVSSEIGYRKKDPEYWVEVLKQLRSRWSDLQPDEIVYFDDSTDSIEGAKSQGVRAILYEGQDQVKAELLV